MRPCCYLLLLMLLAGPLRLAAQEAAPPSLRGRVVDAATGTPLAGAHVFVASSTRGTTTDGDGYFRLDRLPPGAYEIVASMLGYTLASRRVTLPDDAATPLDFRLEATVLEMDEVVVASTRSDEWYRHLEQFAPLLLGHTANASRCDITNPEVLQFSLDEAAGRFRASARAALIVENRALGYRVFFYMKDFEAAGGVVRYLGKMRFEALPPRNRREERRWQRRRRAAYEGSPRHFFATLYHAQTNDDLRRAGFKVGLVPHFEFDPLHTVSAAPEAVLHPEAEPHRRLLAFERHLLVLYRRDQPPSSSGVPGSGPPTPADAYTSWITLNDGPTAIDAAGHLFDPYAVTMYGLWSRERLADALPRDYLPEQ